MGDVLVRFLGKSDEELLRRLYDEVFVPSFAPSEREPFERLRRVLAGDELLGAVAVTPEGEPLGALFIEWFADVRAALLCYFATRPDLRGQGLGRRLIAEATPPWRASLRPQVVFAEAGDPRVHSTEGGDYGDGDARLRLYAGLGARRVPIRYVMPELAPGAGRAHDLLLLAVETAPPGASHIPGAIVEDFLVRYFARQEGPARDDDTELRQLLLECRTGLLPLRELAGG
jgi:GNAT superfamily N-acetyltransferase